MGTFIPGFTCTSFLLSYTWPESCARTGVCKIAVLRFYRTFASAGGSLKVTFLLNVKDLCKFLHLYGACAYVVAMSNLYRKQRRLV